MQNGTPDGCLEQKKFSYQYVRDITRKTSLDVTVSLMRGILAKHQHYISAEFDFLGYHFSRQRLRVAQQTFEQFSKKVDRLYEQTASPLERDDGVVNYVRRWLRWVRSGLRLIMPVALVGDDERGSFQKSQFPELPKPSMMAPGR